MFWRRARSTEVLLLPWNDVTKWTEPNWTELNWTCIGRYVCLTVGAARRRGRKSWRVWRICIWYWIELNCDRTRTSTPRPLPAIYLCCSVPPSLFSIILWISHSTFWFVSSIWRSDSFASFCFVSSVRLALTWLDFAISGTGSNSTHARSICRLVFDTIPEHRTRLLIVGYLPWDQRSNSPLACFEDLKMHAVFYNTRSSYVADLLISKGYLAALFSFYYLSWDAGLAQFSSVQFSPV
jgi:hypothetical protein